MGRIQSVWFFTFLACVLGGLLFGLLYYYMSYAPLRGGLFRTLLLPVAMGGCVGGLMGHAAASRWFGRGGRSKD